MGHSHACAHASWVSGDKGCSGASLVNTEAAMSWHLSKAGSRDVVASMLLQAMLTCRSENGMHFYTALCEPWIDGTPVEDGLMARDMECEPHLI